MREWTEAEAMAILVSSVRAYGRRARVLSMAGSALSLLKDPGRFASALRQEDFLALRKGIAGAEETLDCLRRDGVSLILPDGPGASHLLSETRHPPHVLFCLGLADLTDPFPVGCVGTRDPSPYGIRSARRITRELAEAGCCIVSGLALGIDSACHEGAMAGGGRTVAVLGSALNRLYPRQNAGLMERILSAGGSVVTEYPPGTFASRFSFPERNRIIAGLSLGVFVVEGRERSGALSTATLAASEGREVFSLPGSVEEPRSRLPHRLISEGAKLVTCGADILSEFVIEPSVRLGNIVSDAEGTGRDALKPGEKQSPAQTSSLMVRSENAALSQKEERTVAYRVPTGLGKMEERICQAILEGPVDFDELCERTGIPGGEMGALLIEMELDALVETLPGNAVGPGSGMR